MIKILSKISIFLGIQAVINFLLFPDILESGVFWRGDNFPIVSWSTYSKVQGLYMWKDQLGLGVNAFEHIQFIPLNYFFAFLGNFFNYETLSKMVVVMPVFILVTSVFLLASHIFQDSKIKYLYVICFCVLFAFSSVWLNLVFAGFSFYSICLALLPLYVYFLLKKLFLPAFIVSLTVPFSTLPLAFIFLLVYPVIFLIFESNRRLRILFLVGFLLGNLWWSLPIVLSFVYKTSIDATLLDYSHNIINSFSHSQWLTALLFNTDWNSMMKFGAEPSLVFFLRYQFTVIATIIFCLNATFFLFNRKDNSQKMVLIGVIIVLILASVFVLYIPVARDIFKSSVRFLWVAAFLNLIVFMLFLRDMEKVEKKSLIGAVSLLMLSAVSLSSFILFRNNWEPFTLPYAYVDYLNEQVNSYERVLLLPTDRGYLPESYQPQVSHISWGAIDPLVYGKAESLSLFVRFEPLTDKLVGSFFDNTHSPTEIRQYLDTLRINRVVYRYVTDYPDRKNALDILAAVKTSKKWKCENKVFFNDCKRLEPLSLFEVEGSDLMYTKVFPGKFKLRIENLRAPKQIDFFQSFHSQMKLYLAKSSQTFECDSKKNYGKVDECLSSNYALFEGNEISLLWQKELGNHKVLNDYANAWTIDPAVIKATYPKEYYTENPDGSINVELIVYFKLQAYFYLFILVSLVAVLGVCGYLGYKFKKKKNTYGISH